MERSDWRWVGRWVKTAGKEEEHRKAAETTRDHWREVALDVGLDPDKNVTLSESEKMLAVAITEQMDTLFREEGTSWQYY
jgi:hypothetical protein